jgi:hypothetical protein
VTTFQTQLLNELSAGHNGAPISESKLVYLQERLRARFFEFLIERFGKEQAKGLTKAKLARRIRKSPEVINRWLGAPSNLTLDSISDLMAGISAEELEMDGSKLLNRSPVNYVHLAEVDDVSSQDAIPAKPRPVTSTSNGSVEISSFR